MRGVHWSHSLDCFSVILVPSLVIVPVTKMHEATTCQLEKPSLLTSEYYCWGGLFVTATCDKASNLFCYCRLWYSIKLACCLQVLLLNLVLHTLLLAKTPQVAHNLMTYMVSIINRNYLLVYILGKRKRW